MARVIEIGLLLMIAAQLIHGNNYTFAEYEDSLDSPKKQNLVINGSTTHPRQFPEMVSLRKPIGHHFCAGNILTNSWIITAAHCVSSLAKKPPPKGGAYNFTVIIGQIDQTNVTYFHPRFVYKIIIHPKYKRSPRSSADLALLLVRPCMRTNLRLVHSIELINQKVHEKDVCRIAGWGPKAPHKKKPSHSLRYIDVRIKDEDDCDEGRPGVLCADDPWGKRGVCGDSGSGLVCQGKLAGIARFLPSRHCDAKTPASFTDIFYYKSWIENNTKSGNCWKRLSPEKSGSTRTESVSGILLILILGWLN